MLAKSFSGAGHGFTLIEIAVVILLISIMLLVAVPRLPDSPLTDQTRKTKRWVVLKVQDLKGRAVRDQKTYTLHVGIGSKQLWVTSDDMSDESKEKAEKNAFKLDEDLKVLDVEYPGDQKVESGRADILFFRERLLGPGHHSHGRQRRAILVSNRTVSIERQTV
jgi:prepilin-type N-terminal cleavage/methylation domain-containing protein